MKDLKHLSYKDLKNMRDEIDIELYNRDIDSFSKYKVGDLYIKKDGDIYEIYEIKELTPFDITTARVTIYKASIYIDTIIYSSYELDEKCMDKLNISLDEFNELYAQIKSKFKEIDKECTAKKQVMVTEYKNKIDTYMMNMEFIQTILNK